MNHIFLTGRLTDNPKVTTLASGKDKADFRIAVNRDYAKADGTREVDFFNCVAWSGMAGFCGKYLYKGQRIAIEGRMQTRSYTAEDGSKRWVYEVNIERIEPQEWKKTEEVQEKPEDGQRSGNEKEDSIPMTEGDFEQQMNFTETDEELLF